MVSVKERLDSYFEYGWDFDGDLVEYLDGEYIAILKDDRLIWFARQQKTLAHWDALVDGINFTEIVPDEPRDRNLECAFCETYMLPTPAVDTECLLCGQRKSTSIQRALQDACNNPEEVHETFVRNLIVYSYQCPDHYLCIKCWEDHRLGKTELGNMRVH